MYIYLVYHSLLLLLELNHNVANFFETPSRTACMQLTRTYLPVSNVGIV